MFLPFEERCFTRRKALIAAGAVAMAGWTCPLKAQLRSPRRQAASSTTPPTRMTVSLRYQDLTWDYHVQVPRLEPSTPPLPLVIILHGSGSSGRIYLDVARWGAKAISEGFLAVAPDAQRMKPRGLQVNSTNPRRWNSGQIAPNSDRSRIDDVGFLQTLLDDVSNRWDVDRRRVYIVGHSNGGSMAFRAVNELSTELTAMASVAGHCYVHDPKPDVPLPTLFMVGTRDPLMPLEGGTSVLPWEVRDTPPFRWTTTRWARAIGCPTTASAVERLPEGVKQIYGPADNGAVLLALLVSGQGHHWPGAPDLLVDRVFLGPNIGTLNATDVVWAFFDKYQRS